MNITKTFTSPSRLEWRAWLRKHHRIETEVWFVFFRKGTGGKCISYDEAVEEALCYGWIDSIMRKLDETRYARRFSPRHEGSKWSASNIERMRILIARRRMTRAALRFFDPALLDAPPPVNPGRRELAMPAWIESVFTKHPVAKKNYDALPPSQRRLYLAWILDAKKETTQQRRLAQVIDKLERNQPLGMK
jgi:uncharacterized protein YdeI (YjbR/CyaY-like superfamily)